MTYSPEDLERADKLLQSETGGAIHKAIAQLIADIRNETIERCAAELESQPHWRMAAMRIRALKDGAK